LSRDEMTRDEMSPNPTILRRNCRVSVSVYLETIINKHQIMPQKTNQIRTAFILFPGHLKGDQNDNSQRLRWSCIFSKACAFSW